MLVEIRESKIEGAGLGVFAVREIKFGVLLEICHVIPLGNLPEGTNLYPYQLQWSKEEDAIASGCALFYNHSNQPNAKMVRLHEVKRIHIFASEDIKADEEIFVRYKCDPWWK